MLPYEKLLLDVKSCTHCEASLPLGARPVLNFHPNSKILIVGQAPGTKVHNTGIPWNDPSGNRLREWLSVDRETFYNVNNFSIVPMGYCYPGKGKSGDLPPRKECTELWLNKILKELQNIKLILCIGIYAQDYYLKSIKKKNLTETVKAWKEYQNITITEDIKAQIIPLPHPSPRNLLWLKKNPWFEIEVVPELKKITHNLLKIKTDKN